MSILINRSFLKVMMIVLTLGLGLGVGHAAQAQQVTVMGQTYQVTLHGFGNSFLDNQAQIENSPWFSPGATVSGVDFATAYEAQIGAPAIPSGQPSSLLIFVTSHNAGLIQGATVDRQMAGVSIGTIPPSPNTSASPFAQFASATLVAVPEINAGALGQMLFVLMVLGLLMHRRGRIL